MQTRYYDSEEIFRALILLLSKYKVRYIKQKAFDKYLSFFKDYLVEKYNINAKIFGSCKFKEFTEYSRSRCIFFNGNDDFVIIRNLKEIELREGIFHKKTLESATFEKCLSIFGLTSSQELNETNFCNDISKKRENLN